MHIQTVFDVPSGRIADRDVTHLTTKQLKAFVTRSFDDLASLRTNRVSHNEMCWEVANRVDWLLHYMTLLKEKNHMAKAQKVESVWKGFVNLSLSSEDKSAFAHWDVVDDDVWLLLTDTITSGHKMTLTYDKVNDHFVASFTGGADHKTNAGYTLSAFGKDWYGAIRVLLFKHTAILEGDYSRKLDRPTDNIG